MGEIQKQIAIYLGLLIICMNFTLIAPFFPKVAHNKGIPIWMIGVTFSVNPLVKLIATPFVAKHMPQLGRKRLIMAAYGFFSLSLFLLSPIEFVDRTAVIVLSISSRALGGLGGSCLFTTVNTIFISDYPDKMQVMIGRMEAALGVGLILGPIVGTALFYVNLMAAMAGVGGMILVFAPFAYKMLGTFREYNIQEINMDRFSLLVKPKIILSVFLIVSMLFSVGFMSSTLEIHLSEDYDLSILFISLCFALQSAVYLIFSLTTGYIFKKIDSRLIMVIGMLLFTLGYLMLAPWSLVFPKQLWVIILSLPVMATAQCFVYIFTIPYMVRSAVDCYGYSEDDILNDVIASFAVIGTAVGEIMGPLAAGFMTDYLGFELCCLITSACSLIFCVVLFIGTGYLFDIFKGVKQTNRNFSAYSHLDSRSKLVQSDMELEKSTH